MKLTHKTVARMAGYYTYGIPDKYSWRNQSGWIDEVSKEYFDTEEAAYKDCCEACGLVEKEKFGGGPR